MEFNNLAMELWNKKYFSENDNSIDDVIRRTAKKVASGETNQNDKVKWEEIFYQQLKEMKMIPGGRILNGAGTKNNYLLNCAVLEVKDSLEDIYKTIQKAAMMFK